MRIHNAVTPESRLNEIKAETETNLIFSRQLRGKLFRLQIDQQNTEEELLNILFTHKLRIRSNIFFFHKKAIYDLMYELFESGYEAWLAEPDEVFYN